ncbi:unnamed protein product [Gongylonema pulchrum]|uniref:Uncharacterized protein n=1 Tax=Gongylonema pulchrum TaxID=637853 RepID=A0A3P7P2K8_9BILA|nr:unnamed protein product [Gongylonema pulchrum]
MPVVLSGIPEQVSLRTGSASEVVASGGPTALVTNLSDWLKMSSIGRVRSRRPSLVEWTQHMVCFLAFFCTVTSARTKNAKLMYRST